MHLLLDYTLFSLLIPRRDLELDSSRVLEVRLRSPPERVHGVRAPVDPVGPEEVEEEHLGLHLGHLHADAHPGPAAPRLEGDGRQGPPALGAEAAGVEGA